MIIFAKICISNDYRSFILLFVHPAEFLICQPLSCALNALLLALQLSAKAFVEIVKKPVLGLHHFY